MRIVISPAKSLNFEDKIDGLATTLPAFPKETLRLVSKLKNTSKKKIKEMMSISDALVDLNVNRYKEFSEDYTDSNSKAAIYAFTGDVYVGMDALTMGSEDIAFANEHLRILSGLYGILKPLDRIQPYRLEMGTSFPIARKPNIVQFWKERVTKYLNEEMATDSDPTLINLASQEYFHAVDTKKLKARIVNCSFKEDRDGVLKIISFNAKKARGLMCRYIIQNKLTNVEDLKGFDSEGYYYSEEHSDENNLTFLR